MVPAMPKEKRRLVGPCERCGKQVDRIVLRGSMPSFVFCSEACRISLYRAKRPPLERYCKWCSDPLDTAKPLQARYCDNTCAEKYHGYMRRLNDAIDRPHPRWCPCGNRLPLFAFSVFKFCSKECKEAVHNRDALTKYVEPLRLRDGDNCSDCGDLMLFEGYPHPMYRSVDHIVARSNGGPDLMENFQLMHGSCNSRKCNR